MMEVAGPPAAYSGAAVEEDFHKADHAGTVDFDAGMACGSQSDGQGHRLRGAGTY